MQLVAYGAQDVYLTGNPQITFFKVVYRRHTNFSMEAIEQTWNGSTTADGRCTATISRNGDLVHRMYIEAQTDNCRRSDNPGVSWIKSVELEIGGQKIDKHSGVWMETWAELTELNPSSLVNTCTTTTAASGRGTLFHRMAGYGGVSEPAAGADLLFNIPLQFWFCRNPGLALPLIALQYHEVKVILEHKFTTSFGTTTVSNKLWADYIYLDTDERRRFAQVSHEYLIEQVQEQSIPSGANSVDLNFNHPVKELIWTCGSAADTSGRNSASLVSPSAAITDKFTLKLNGHDRFAAREHPYFSRVQVWQHHTGCGGLDCTDAGTDGNGANDSICVYSFALKPEEHQPSGTCNFSRIDNAQLNTSNAFFTSANIKIFAVNYNVLRIMSGMGGLAYSN